MFDSVHVNTLWNHWACGQVASEIDCVVSHLKRGVEETHRYGYLVQRPLDCQQHGGWRLNRLTTHLERFIPISSRLVLDHLTCVRAALSVWRTNSAISTY
jgi:hypothetical protein